MLFIQVFCVFTFLVFCLDFYLYNRESLKTKIITVEFFGFYSIFFCVFFFFRVWVNILLPLVCFLFSVYVYLEWMGVYVCAPTLPNICSCPNAILLWRCFVFILFTTGIFMCVCVSVLLFMSFFYCECKQTGKTGKHSHDQATDQRIVTKKKSKLTLAHLKLSNHSVGDRI